jgi:hypothetical protein
VAENDPFGRVGAVVSTLVLRNVPLADRSAASALHCPLARLDPYG